jgi:AAA+ ATPase superfamily predicted ATPase
LLKKTPFVGRKKELRELSDVSSLVSARLVVVSGRRRIGKTRLVEKFSQNKKYLYFSGKAPGRLPVSEEDQIETFVRIVIMYFGDEPKKKIVSWYEALRFFSNNLEKDIGFDEPVVIMFDEISWLGDGNDFVPELKLWWETKILGYYSNLVLVLSGSVSTWIEKNIIRSTALFGRISGIITLGPLKMPEAIRLLRKSWIRWPLRTLLEILIVVGGVPWYLEHFDSGKSIDEKLMKI